MTGETARRPSWSETAEVAANSVPMVGVRVPVIRKPGACNAAAMRSGDRIAFGTTAGTRRWARTGSGMGWAGEGTDGERRDAMKFAGEK